MLVCQLGSFRSTWINYHQLATAFAHALQALADTGRGHDATVTRNRVSTHDDHKICAINIWHRNSEFVAKHVVGGKVMR